MFEIFSDAASIIVALIVGVLEHGAERAIGIWAALREQGPSPQTVLTLQLIVGLLTIFWIVFQFAWLRRLNEARLERHLESTITDEREKLADERSRTLEELERVRKLRGPFLFLVYFWAHVRLTVSLIVKMLTFGNVKGLADHNILLMKAGAEERARGLFTDIARDAIKKIKLYKDAVDNKTLEAQNALIFAGRVALVEGRSAAAVMLFDAAKNLKDDPDARLLIGRQMLVAGGLEQAKREFEHVLASPGIEDTPTTHADANRALAEVLIQENARVRARSALGVAEGIESRHRLELGLGKTKELIGDLFAPRKDRRAAARKAYADAKEAFERAGYPDRVRQVRRKLAKLEDDDGEVPEPHMISLLETWGNWMLTQAAMRRARARKKAD